MGFVSVLDRRFIGSELNKSQAQKSWTLGAVSVPSLLSSVVLAGMMATPLIAQTYNFSSIEIDGNLRVEDGTILSRSGLELGQPLSAGALNDAVQNIRNTGLFESVNVVPKGRVLSLDVVEYPVINVINVEGNSKLRDEQLLAVVQSEPRRVFNPAQVERDVTAIANVYANRGRINAVVTPQIIRRSENRVDVVFEVNEAEVTEIERISFIGNRSFSENRLRRVLATKEAGLLRLIFTSDTFVEDRIEFDRKALSDFYKSRGYADFQIQNVNVTLTQERDAHLITFNIQEGQQYTFGDVSFSSEFDNVDTERFENRLYTSPGAVYSPVVVSADIDRLERLAVQQGVNFARIEPVITRDDEDLRLNVVYRMAKGEPVFVERIDIEGNNTTLDRVIRNQFRLAEGDSFNPREIRNSAERIKALGFFASSNVQTRPGSASDRVIVDVDVEEKNTGNLSFGGNYSSGVGLGIQASYKQNNFLGRGQRLNFTISTARTNKQLSLSFAEPNFLDRDLGFDAGVSYKKTDNESAVYDTESFNINAGLNFPVSDNGRLSVFYRSEFTDLSDVSSSVSKIIQNETGRGRVWSHGGGYTYSYDSKRSNLEPNSRYRLRFGQDFGFGDTKFVKTTGLASAERKVFAEEVTLRATLEGGIMHYANNDSRVTDRFFSNSQTIRGFNVAGLGPRDKSTSDSLGGNKFVAARLEAEFSLGLPEEFGLSGGLFADYGSIWDVGNTFGEDVLYNEFTPRAIVGASVFWTTPIGPLRFNFTKPLRSESEDETNSFEVTVDANF